ncbi:hypothetical protein KFE98_17790 [bacterium SCSIO 12741]|nr:hypothetical protein KFE98_17790 [bacterium SCSIO 12741]
MYYLLSWRRWLSFLVLLILGGLPLISQAQTSCGTSEAHRFRMLHDAEFRQQIHQLEEQMARLQQTGSRSAVNGIYRIPVVFHIITNPINLTGNYSSPEYEMYTKYNNGWSRIQDQLDRLNDEFASSNIQFCLAQKAPESYQGVAGVPGSWQELSDGINPSFTSVGVTYTVHNSLGNFQASDAVQVAAMEAILPFNQPQENHYLDIYVVDQVINVSYQSVGGESSYGVGYPFDDVTVISGSVGNEDVNPGAYSLTPGATQGKLLVHEVGHWLLLKHVFEVDEECNATAVGMTGDHLPGTPSQQESHMNYPGTPPAGIGSGITSCNGSSPLYFNNHMDYTSDINKITINGVKSFVTDQNNRMNNFAGVARTQWFSVLNRIQTGIETTGCIPNYTPQNFTAEFTADRLTLCAGEEVSFSGMGIDHLPANSQITGWTFTFTETSGATSAQTVNYGGNYPVTFTLSTGEATSLVPTRYLLL